MGRHDGQHQLGFAYKCAIGVYLYAVILFSYQDDFTAYAKLAGLGLGGLFLLRAIYGPQPLVVPKEYRFLVAWFIVAVISSALSREVSVAFPRVLTLLQIFPLAFVVSVMLIWNGSTRFYWVLLASAAAVCGLVGLIDPVRGSQIDGRMFGTLDHPNHFAALMVVAACICLVYTVGKRPLLMRIGAAASIVFFVYLVGRSGSRTGALAVLVGVVTFVLCLRAGGMTRSAKGVILAVVAGTGLVIGTAVFLTSTDFSTRLFSLLGLVETGNLSAVGEESLRGRLWMMRAGIDVLLENPLIGVGLDVFRTVDVIAGRAVGNNSHSNYIEILADTGIVGGILYYAMYVHWWSRLVVGRSLLRDPRLATNVALGTMIASAVLVFDVGFVSYYGKLTWLVLAGLIAEVNLLPVAGEMGRPFMAGRRRGFMHGSFRRGGA